MGNPQFSNINGFWLIGGLRELNGHVRFSSYNRREKYRFNNNLRLKIASVYVRSIRFERIPDMVHMRCNERNR